MAVLIIALMVLLSSMTFTGEANAKKGKKKMIYYPHIKELVDETLQEMKLHSPEASDLVLETFAQESGLGTALKQYGNGPAKGIGQCERGTFNWLKDEYKERLEVLGMSEVKFEDLRWNIKAAIVFCRLRYFFDPNPIPKSRPERALYWKRIYNTSAGKGTPQEFLKNCKRCIDKQK